MACNYICDCCGKEKPAELINCEWKKPGKPLWFSRVVDGVRGDACSRKCAEKLDKDPSTGFTGF